MSAAAHVICTQNHDQVGNRAKGERLTALVPRGARTLAAALLLLAPQRRCSSWARNMMSPILFTSSPTTAILRCSKPCVKAASRSSRNLISPTRVPDPQDPATFERSKLNWQLTQGENPMLDWYTSLLALRKKFIKTCEPTCEAKLIDGIIHMQVPCEEPTLKVFAPDSGLGPAS